MIHNQKEMEMKNKKIAIFDLKKENVSLENKRKKVFKVFNNRLQNFFHVRVSTQRKKYCFLEGNRLTWIERTYHRLKEAAIVQFHANLWGIPGTPASIPLKRLLSGRVYFTINSSRFLDFLELKEIGTRFNNRNTSIRIKFKRFFSQK